MKLHVMNGSQVSSISGYVTNALMSRNACNGENGETGEKSPAAGDLN